MGDKGEDFGPRPTIDRTTTTTSLKGKCALTGTGVGLSFEELESLKRSNTLAYLKVIINAKENSFEKSISASTVSRGRSSTDMGNDLLQKIKAKAFEVDLFLLLKRDPFSSFALKDLLKQA